MPGAEEAAGTACRSMRSFDPHTGRVAPTDSSPEEHNPWNSEDTAQNPRGAELMAIIP